MNSKIKMITFFIEEWKDLPGVALRIRINETDKEYCFDQILHRNDWQSNLERIFEIALKSLKNTQQCDNAHIYPRVLKDE